MKKRCAVSVVWPIDLKSPLYIRCTEWAELAVATGDYELAEVLIEDAFLTLDKMCCQKRGQLLPKDIAH
jgi:hypothetical protein